MIECRKIIVFKVVISTPLADRANRLRLFLASFETVGISSYRIQIDHMLIDGVADKPRTSNPPAADVLRQLSYRPTKPRWGGH
jgi:hypothetical protein